MSPSNANATTLSDFNSVPNDGAAAAAGSEHPTILNSISLNASRDRMNELFKDFKRLNTTDAAAPSNSVREITDGDTENEKVQGSAEKPQQPRAKHYNPDFTQSTASIDIKPQEQKVTALYVGDLDLNVTEEQLYSHFKGYKSLASVKICHAPGSRASLGYGYINFSSEEEAMDAVEELNYTPILAKEIRIMPSLKGRDKLSSLGTNVFISNLNVSEVTSLRAFYEKFRSYGKILSCKLDLRKRQGFVSFEHRSSAEAFVLKVNETMVDGLKIYCSIHIPKSLRDGSINLGSNPANSYSYDQATVSSSPPSKLRKNSSTATMETVIFSKSTGSRLIKSPIESPLSPSMSSGYLSGPTSPLEATRFKQVYVKGLPVNVTEDQLKAIFDKFGEITEIFKENVPKFKSSWGLVTFDTEEAALNAVKTIHKSTYEGKKITCVKALKKTDRQLQLLKDKPNLVVPLSIRNCSVKEAAAGSSKLYIYNLPHGINENFFKVFLRSYTLEGGIKKYNINYPKSEDNYIEFEKESDAKEVLAKLNGVQISGSILQASMYRLRPAHAATQTSFATPSIRRVSFQEEDKTDKYVKKVYNYPNDRMGLGRSNSAIFANSQQQQQQQPSALAYAQLGQMIPSSIARNAPLYQTINGNRYKLVPATRTPTDSFPPAIRPYDVFRSTSLVKPELNVNESLVTELEQLAIKNANFLQFPSAARPRNLKRIVQYMIENIWGNNNDTVKDLLEQVATNPGKMEEFERNLNETLTLFGFGR